MESENNDIVEELRLVSEARQESESKRRKQEQQISEYVNKYQDAERVKQDLQEKYSKASVGVGFY